VQDQHLGVDGQRRAHGQLQVAGVHRGTDRHALHVDLDAGRDVRGLGLHRDLDQLLVEHAVRGHLAGHLDRDLNGDLLAAADQDQVDVVDGAPDRVALHGLGQGQLAAALQPVQADQHVRGAQREQHVVAGQAHVPRVGPVAVQHGGHPALAAHLAGGTFAELAAQCGSDAYLGHGRTPQRQKNSCEV
jgi:hypothetical protein